MPTCCAVFISANVGRLVTVVTTVIIEIAFPQNWDTFAVVAGEFRFRIARTIIWNENEQLIKNQKINVILKIEVIRPNMISKTDKINIYLEFEVSEQEKKSRITLQSKYKLTRHLMTILPLKLFRTVKFCSFLVGLDFLGLKYFQNHNAMTYHKYPDLRRSHQHNPCRHRISRRPKHIVHCYGI